MTYRPLVSYLGSAASSCGARRPSRPGIFGRTRESAIESGLNCQRLAESGVGFQGPTQAHCGAGSTADKTPTEGRDGACWGRPGRRTAAGFRPPSQV